MSYKFSELFKTYGLSEIKLHIGFVDVAFTPSAGDQEAAWELYIELITRVTTQQMCSDVGDEETALTSVYSLFGVTREILKRKGRDAQNFSKIAIIVLNQIIRPFTAKWHKKKISGAFSNKDESLEFRDELLALQTKLRGYTKMLADIAMVEDLTNIDGCYDLCNN